MIKVLNSSNNLSTWYYKPAFSNGDGTKDNPFNWLEESTDGGTSINCNLVNSGDHNWYVFSLTGGTTYNFTSYSNSYPVSIRIYLQSDPDTVLADRQYTGSGSSSFSFVPSTSDLYLFEMYSDPNACSSCTGTSPATISPIPNEISSEGGYEKKLIDMSTGIDDIGYLNKYQDIEDANIMFKENTNDKYSKLYISFENDIYDSAEGNSSPMTLNATNVSIENGFGIFNNSQINCTANNFDFTSDTFTIDFYINFSSLPTSDSWSGTSTIFAAYDSEGSAYQNALRFGNNNINFQYEDNNWIISTPMIMSINKWYYFALVKNMNQYYMFINGKKVAESTNDYSLPNYPNCQLFHEARTSYFNGKIKNFNMSFGIARYIKDFNPPKVNGIILE